MSIVTGVSPQGLAQLGCEMTRENSRMLATKWTISSHQMDDPQTQPRLGRIWRSLLTRSSIGGWVEKRPAIPLAAKGLTM